MIRTDVIVNTKAIDNLQAFARLYPEYVADTVNATFVKYQPRLLEELRTQPGAVKYPIQWSSDRQRRAFFATKGFGKGIPYKRSGKTARSWYAWVRRSGNRFELNVANNSPHGRFVYGDLRPKPGGDPQQRFHRITGWQRMSATVDFWAAGYQEEVGRQLYALANRIGG